jgi:mannosyltransferase
LDKNIPDKPIQVLIGNSSKRFSGVTSTMLQTAKIQQGILPIAIIGEYHTENDFKTLTFFQVAKLCRNALPKGRYRIFHARRNNEMLQAVCLKYIFGAKIKIIFTATAQRHPTWITRWLISKADGLITTSNIAAAFLPRKADVIIPHGIDTMRYHPPIEGKANAWHALNLGGEFGIGIFGRIRPQKGVDILIDAMLEILKQNRNCEATVVIVGETTKKYVRYLDSLKKRIRDSGFEERFLFLGKLPFEDIPKLFRGMSIVAALSRNEGFGLTVLEAMSSGAAVIASEAGAWPDIIKGDNYGKLVPINDLRGTISALNDLLSRPLKDLERMGMEGHKLVLDNYRLETEAQKLVNFYQHIQANEN